MFPFPARIKVFFASSSVLRNSLDPKAAEKCISISNLVKGSRLPLTIVHCSRLLLIHGWWCYCSILGSKLIPSSLPYPVQDSSQVFSGSTDTGLFTTVKSTWHRFLIQTRNIGHWSVLVQSTRLCDSYTSWSDGSWEWATSSDAC